VRRTASPCTSSLIEPGSCIPHSMSGPAAAVSRPSAAGAGGSSSFILAESRRLSSTGMLTDLPVASIAVTSTELFLDNTGVVDVDVDARLPLDLVEVLMSKLVLWVPSEDALDPCFAKRSISDLRRRSLEQTPEHEQQRAQTTATRNVPVIRTTTSTKFSRTGSVT